MRCLIVDDNPAFLDAASALLEREGAGMIAVASTGEEALARTAELRPDVVLIDIGLRGESGFDLARRLAEPRSPAPLLILISTQDEADLADLIAQSPAAGFIPKSELSLAAIERLLAAR